MGHINNMLKMQKHLLVNNARLCTKEGNSDERGTMKLRADVEAMQQTLG